MSIEQRIEQPVYLSLAEACRQLGVHSNTLRRWADNGMLPVYYTPGGHRRFALTDVQALRERPPASATPLAEPNANSLATRWASHALAQTRSELREGDQHPAWMSRLTDDERAIWRHVSMRLMGVVLRYINADPDPKPDLLQEARAVGDDYATHARRLGIPLTAALEAALFFRDALIEAAMDMPEQTSTTPATSARLLRRINQVLNVVQLAVAAGYEK